MGTNLRYIKLTTLDAVPRYLFEQVKPREFDVDALYKWGPIIIANPLNLFGAFLDKEQAVKGVLWSSFNPISNKIHCHILSIDKEYFGCGILKEARGILNKNKKKLGAEKVTFTTTRPTVFEKIFGCEKISIMMEK